ncbi:MAG: hypothetical protein V4617_16905 [Gemmatimonadota bacterium]
MRPTPLLSLVLPALLAGCAPSRTLPAQQPPVQPPGATGAVGGVADTLDPNFVPAGFGSLRQDDIALKFSPSNGLQVRAIPLDERWIRLLSPDSYRTLREQINSKARALEAVTDRERLPSYSIWSVSFSAIEQGETRFSPREFIITNVGRDFRPLDILPLQTGFGEYRLKQRETQTALLIFDGQLDVNQPLTAQMEGTPSITNWNEIIRRVERERSLVRSRAAAKSKVPPPP